VGGKPSTSNSDAREGHGALRIEVGPGKTAGESQGNNRRRSPTKRESKVQYIGR